MDIFSMEMEEGEPRSRRMETFFTILKKFKKLIKQTKERITLIREYVVEELE